MSQYRVGDIITTDLALVHVLNEEQKSTYCDYCCLENDNLKKCMDCKMVHYCNKLCQKSDWKCHKYECKFYKHHYDVLKRSLDRFLLRLYLLLRNKPQLAEKELVFSDVNRTTRSYKQLMEHQDEIRLDVKRMQTFKFVCERFAYCQVPFAENELFSHFCKICINTFEILNTDLNGIAVGLFVLGSAFDHSCEPNTAPTFTGNYLEIRAIKDIQLGDKITVNYTDLANQKEARQKILKEQYYFQCKCSRCQSDFDKEFDYEKLKKLKEEIDTCIDQQDDWDKGYDCGLQAIELLDNLYDGVHPDLTVELVRVLKIRLMISQDLDNEAILLVSRIKKQIQYTHGHQHDLGKKFREMLY